MTLSAPANLLKSANAMCIGNSSGIDKRAIVLALVIMAAAGDFVGGLRWDRAVMWKGSRHYLRNTNLDVIAAEAIVWMHFLMRQFWEKNVEKEYQSFMQTGRIEVSVVTHRRTGVSHSPRNCAQYDPGPNRLRLQ